METLAKVFWVNLPASDKSRAFSASGRIVSPEPDFSSEANQHPLIELLSADHVQAISQVFSARAQRVLASKGRWRGSLDLAKVLLSYLIIKV